MKNKKYLNKIHCGYCEKILKGIQKESIDFIITSPPYANQRTYGIDCQNELQALHPDNYVEWFLPKAKEFFRVLKPTGSFILNINDKTINCSHHIYVYELVIYLVKKIGFNLVRDYIWFNPATPPNVFSSGKYGRTKKSHEYCFWFSKGEDWVFNLDEIRKPYSKSMQTYLKGQGRGNRNQNTRPSTHSFNCEKIWENNGGSDPGSVIHINEPDYDFNRITERIINDPGDVFIVSNTGSKNSFKQLCSDKGIQHPARYPEQLVEFFIRAGTNEGDVILDPFLGSGTTAIVAHNLNRNWIGIEANRDYCELARHRIENELNCKENK